MAVKWLGRALENIETVAEHIAKDSPKRAASFVKELRSAVHGLEEFPGMGRSGRLIGTRELVLHKNYIAVYRVVRGHVEVLRVRHVAQKADKQHPNF